MKVALILMPAWQPQAPPVGISILKSYLESQGHSVTTIDFNVEIFDAVSVERKKLWDMELSHNWQKADLFQSKILPIISPFYKKLAKKLFSMDIDAVGFSTNVANLLATRDMARILRKLTPERKIFFGGPGVEEKSIAFDFNQGLIDAAIFGEGERSCSSLLNYWDTGEESSLSGVALNVDEVSGVVNGRKELIDLTHSPMPDYSDYDFSKYSIMSIEYSRGCVAKCSFCCETNYWRKYRAKTAIQVVDEMDRWSSQSGIKHFRVVDSLMNGNHDQLREIAEVIVERNLDVNWFGFCRIDKRLTPELLSLLKKAGCISISFGIES